MGSLEYLAATLPQKDAFFRLCGLMFDEIKTANKAQLDQKIDAIIGPCSQVSHRHNWVVAIMKSPIYL